MYKLTVLVPLANDAEKNLQAMEYTDIGPNMKWRVDEAVVWQEHVKIRAALWCFGAGTDEAFSRGITLGSLAKHYLYHRHSLDMVLANEGHHNYYGTLEEMKWAVNEIEKNSQPADTRFVFFGPNWQLWRARFIWLLFFRQKWGKATFVVTHDEAQFELWHECKAWARILLVRAGRKSRDQIPYPPITQTWD